MSKQRIGMQIVLALVLVVLLTSLAPAQTFRGRITGIVTDESKGVAAGAKVTLTNVGFACLAMLGSADEEKL